MPDTEQMPDVVYHYTYMEALLKIIEKRELWATSVNYVNDVSEHRHFIRAATQHVEAFALTHDGVDTNLFHEHEAGESSQATSFRQLPFVASLSRQDDSLTHWRSYCTGGNGVSVGFRTKSLVRARVREPKQPLPGMLIPQTVFAPITYVDPDSTVMIHAALEDAYTYAVQERGSFLPGFEDMFSIANLFFRAVQGGATFYKDKSFQDEREFRLAVGEINYRQDLLMYRTSRSTLVPYVPLSVPNTDGGGKDLPWDAVASITIGPTPNMDLSLDAVRTHCEFNAIYGSVQASRVAYRDW